MSGLPRVSAAIAIIWRGDRVLTALRSPDVFLAGMREFPGGKIEPGETADQCAVREAKEETGYEIRLTGKRPPLNYDYLDRCVTLYPFDAEIEGGTESPGVHWMSIGELRNEDFPPATAPLLDDLRAGRT